MEDSTESPILTLKLLIDKSSKKVLFAEAGKDAIDFLFSILSIPIGNIVKLLLTEEGMVGCIGSLYKSLESLDETYLQSNQVKAVLLNPTISSASLPRNASLLLTGSSTEHAPKIYYRCTQGYDGCSAYYSDVIHSLCPRCRNPMSTVINYVVPNTGNVAAAPAVSGSGFVKGVVTYTVMDDLTVTPMSTISGITLLTKFNVKDVGSLEERTVTLGMKEGLKMLKASLQSKTVLSDVFLVTKTASN